MTTPHSPLPPEPTPSLETLDAKMKKVIDVVELTKDTVEKWDAKWNEKVSFLIAREKSLHSIALQLRLGPSLRMAYVAGIALVAGMAGGAIGGVLLSACSR